LRELIINGRRIADDEPCYVIAEIGNNHGGSATTALEMVMAAADAGCEAVKFQRRANGTLYSRELLDKPYENLHSFGRTYGEHRAALELPLTDYAHVYHTAENRGLACFATAFDELSADELEAVIDPPAFKLASGALQDYALIKHVASLGKPVILSTGGGTLRQIDMAVETLSKHTTRFALLHATAAYPATFDELNLRCIRSMWERYRCVIGWSCHVHNISMMMAAYALGARIIECHFTLNRTMKGTDHAFSLEPATMKKLCKDLSRAHVALGDGIKKLYPSEVGPLSKMRRVETRYGLQITGDTSWATSALSACSRTS
jgi:N-acetylneuraminate synthase/sialic acid synthase